MKLIIDIDEETYNRYILWQKDGGHVQEAEEIIANGTPLPKGHGDLIDRNALITELETDYHRSLSESGAHLFVEITSYIDDAETIVEADTESDNETDN